MLKLKNFKIGRKIGGGFTVVLITLVAVGGLGSFGLNLTATDFKDYRSSAQSTNEVALVQANLLMTRLNAKDFVIDGTQQ